jgi:hypothetical protein
VIEIPLTQGQVALIDDEDFELVLAYKWNADLNKHTKSFYAVTNVTKPDGKRTKLLMHRLIMRAQKGQQVDHIHHLTLDNRKQELRLCTRNENAHNTGRRIDNASGYKGVSWHKSTQKWRAEIQVDGKRKHLGCFSDADRANEVCMAARAELHGEFARTVW